MVLVQPEGRPVWLGAPGHRSAGLGLFRVERSPAEGQRLVYTQTPDVFPCGRRSAAAPLVDTGGATPPPNFPFDSAARPPARPPCTGGGGGGHPSSLARF